MNTAFKFGLADRFGLHRNRTKASANSHGLVFSLTNYLKVLRESESINAAIIATFRLSMSAMIAEYPTLFDESDPVHVLILHGEKGGMGDIVWAEACDQLGGTNRTRYLQLWEVVPQFPTIDGKKNLARGVHHPKYMLIFTDKGLHVIITTSNFNESDCTDGTWHSFFPFISKDDKDNECLENREFGEVLQDFLEKQSEQVDIANVATNARVVSRNCVTNWIEKYTKVQSIKDEFNFSSAANVKLVSTVPCRQPLPPLTEKELQYLEIQSSFDHNAKKVYPCEECVQEEKMLAKKTIVSYGSRRIKELLKQNSYLNSCSLGKLTLQQTSIGISINNSFMDTFLQDLMTEANWEEDSPSLIGRREDNYEIIWPSLIFMHEIRCHFLLQSFGRLKSTSWQPSGEEINSYFHNIFPHETQDSELQDEDTDEEEAMNEERERRQGILFFQPSFYASMEPDIHSQFYTYEPWPQVAGIFAPCRYLVPHIKSYCRLLNAPPVLQPADPHTLGSAKKHRRQFSTSNLASLESSSKMLYTETADDKNITHSQDDAAQLRESCVCPKLAWTWLTSACLSRGAQGRIVPYSVCECCGHARRGYYEYRNFELGILFMSTPSRQYVALTPTCPVHQKVCVSASSLSSSMNPISLNQCTPEMIPLPLPYQITASRSYCNSRHELMICPYFHQPWEICKYVAEFRTQDPLECPYPSASNNRTTAFHSLQTQTGRKRSFYQTEATIHSYRNEQKFGYRNENETTKSDNHLARRKFHLHPQYLKDTKYFKENGNEPRKNLNLRSSFASIWAKINDENDFRSSPMTVGDEKDTLTERTQNIRLHSQRASFPPDAFSSSHRQWLFMSQHHQWGQAQCAHLQATEEKEVEDCITSNSLADTMTKVYQSPTMPVAHDRSMVAKDRCLGRIRIPSSFYLQSLVEENGSVQYKLEQNVEIDSRSDEHGVSHHPITEPSAPSFSLYQEISETGEVVYKLKRSENVVV